eukprot:3552670-Prymnesium_polylepis.1
MAPSGVATPHDALSGRACRRRFSLSDGALHNGDHLLNITIYILKVIHVLKPEVNAVGHPTRPAMIEINIVLVTASRFEEQIDGELLVTLCESDLMLIRLAMLEDPRRTSTMHQSAGCPCTRTRDCCP